MKKIAISLVAATLFSSGFLFAEENQNTTIQQDQTTQSAPCSNAKKKDCGSVAANYANKAQMFKDKAAKATAKGDAKMAELFTNCSTAAQGVSDQMNAMIKLKSECMANSSCGAMMMKKDKSCGAMNAKACMKKAQMCDKMSQKMAKKADTETDSAAAVTDKACSEMQAKMSAQFKSIASAQEAFAKAQNDLKTYKDSLKQAKKASKDSDTQNND